MNEKELNKKIDYYLSLPYTYEIEPQSDGTYFITIKELKGCMSEGNTISEAEIMIKDAMESWLESMLECGNEIPLPESMQKEFSGKILIRISKELHKNIVQDSLKEGISLNSYIGNSILEKQLKNKFFPEIQSKKESSKELSSENILKFGKKLKKNNFKKFEVNDTTPVSEITA